MHADRGTKTAPILGSIRGKETPRLTFGILESEADQPAGLSSLQGLAQAHRLGG